MADPFENWDTSEPSYEAQSKEIIRELAGELAWDGTEEEFNKSLETFIKMIRKDFPMRSQFPHQRTLPQVYGAFAWLRRENEKISGPQWKRRMSNLLAKLAQAGGALS